MLSRVSRSEPCVIGRGRSIGATSVMPATLGNAGQRLAQAQPGSAVEQLASDLQVSRVGGGLLDEMEADLAHSGRLLGVGTAVVSARCRVERGDGQHLVGLPRLVAVVGQ